MCSIVLASGGHDRPTGISLAASSTSTLAWSRVDPPAAPPPLSGASVAYDSDNRTVVLFGGEEADGSLSSDTWVYTAGAWVDYPSSDIPSPPARQGGAMAFDPQLHQLILFGGQAGDRTELADTWAWNGASWYAQTTQTEPGPTARTGAAMAADGDGHLVLYGGSGPVRPLNSPSTTTTGSTTTVGTPSPGTVAAATAGPSGVGTVLDDTWLWTATGWAPTTATGPPPLTGASLAPDPAGGVGAVLFGGSTAPGPTAGGSPAAATSATWTWDGAAWQAAKPALSPPARVGAVLVTDDQAGTVLLTGGAGAQGTRADSWTWDGGTWAAITGRSGPPARVQAAGAYDGASGAVIVFGGSTASGTVLGDMYRLAPVLASSGPPSSPSSSSASTAAHPTTSARPPMRRSEARPVTTTTRRPPPTTAVPLTTPPSAAPLGTTARLLHPGQQETLSGSGFAPGARITIEFHSVAQVLAYTTADAAGRFRVSVTVPAEASSGSHHFTASGEWASGALAELVTEVTVAAIAVHHHAGHLVQDLVMVGVALALPAGAWGVMVGRGRWRRKRLTAG